MGLFNRGKNVSADIDQLLNAIQVNNVDENAVIRPFTFGIFGKGRKDYAAMFFYMIMERIFNALRNISWRTTEINYTAEDIVHFVETNCQLIVHHYFKQGFACVIADKLGVRFPYQNELRFDSRGRVVNKDAIVVYSDPYSIERKTHYMLIRPMLDAINNNLNNSDFATSNLGLFGILNGKGVPISPAAKEELQDKLKKQYGYGDDKFQFILSNTELDFKPIQIPVDSLKLNDNVDFEIKQVCRFFGINPDYLFGGSTFSNQAEAVRAFYKDCIIPLAEVLLQLARASYIYMNSGDRPSTIITYDLSNVGEFNTTLSDNCAERSAYLDYLLKLRDAGIDVSAEIKKLYEDSKRLLRDV